MSTPTVVKDILDARTAALTCGATMPTSCELGPGEYDALKVWVDSINADPALLLAINGPTMRNPKGKSEAERLSMTKLFGMAMLPSPQPGVRVR